MPEAFEADIDLGTALSDIGKLSGNVDHFENVAAEKVDAEIEDVAKEFRDEVVENLEQSDIENRNNDLFSSWKVRSHGELRYQVHSTDEDVAVMMEVGTPPHRISGNDWLKFKPDDSRPYPSRKFFIATDPESRSEGSGIDASGDTEIVGDFGRSGIVRSPLDPLSDAEPGTYFAKSVQHPGTEPYRYFWITWRAKDWQQKLDDAVSDALSRALEEAKL